MKIGFYDNGFDYTVETPYIKPLGGTQSSIVYFINSLNNHNVTTYLFTKSNLNNITINNTIHYDIEYFGKVDIDFDLIIISCYPIIYKKIYNCDYWLWTGHDIDQTVSKLLYKQHWKNIIDCYIFVSYYQAHRFQKEYGINNYIIMPYGLPKPFEKYLDCDINKIPDSLIYSSTPFRGLDLLPNIYDKLENKPLLKIFSGMNIYSQKDDLTMFDKFSKYPNIKCSLGINQIDLAEEISNIDIFCYPNTFPETFCISLIQAMACGCYVITSNLGALSEISHSSKGVKLINLTNNYIDDFVESYKDYIKTPNKIAEENREIVKKYYLWDNITLDFLKKFPDTKLYWSNYKTDLSNFIEYIKIADYKKQIEFYDKFSKFKCIDDMMLIKFNLAVSFINNNILDIGKKLLIEICEISNNFLIYRNLVLISIRMENIEDFIKYSNIAIDIDFNIELVLVIADFYTKINKVHLSIGLYESILKIDPNNSIALNNLGNILIHTIANYENTDIIFDMYYKAYKTNKNNQIISNIIFNNLYDWTKSEKDIYEWARKFEKLSQCSELKIVNNNDKIDLNKIKIGIISSDFITHPVGYMIESIFKSFNVNKFEYFCYDNRPRNDFISNRLHSYKGINWYDISILNDNNCYDLINSHNIDILIDMMGHTRGNRLNILKYKPCKILVSYFAYPSTSGLSSYDWRITDEILTPENLQEYWIEKFYYLPIGIQCYTPPFEIESKMRNYDIINLCCFNNPSKLSPQCFDCFAEILKKIPNATLYMRYYTYLSSYYRNYIYTMFQKRGINKERLNIGHCLIKDYLESYNSMHIALDTFPYNGGTISSECLYMGTPLITLIGTNYVSRVGASLLTSLNLQDLICNNTEQYIDKVVELANDTERLKILHSTLREKMLDTPLANSSKFTKSLEDGFIDMSNKYNNIF